MIAHALHKVERSFETAFIEIVEEQSAYAARFIPMRQKEIAVAPLLVVPVCFRAERPAGVARRAVPMQDVFDIRVIRREIETAAKPPMGSPGAWAGDQEPDIAVRRRRVRIFWMKHQGQTHRLERRAGNIRSQARGRGRHLVAEDMRERHTRPLEYRAVAKDAT